MALIFRFQLAHRGTAFRPKSRQVHAIGGRRLRPGFVPQFLRVADKLRLASPDRRFLHVLPKVWLTGGQLEMLGRRRAKLTVSSNALDGAIHPSSKIAVRRPYRNGHNLIGGTKTTALGWLVELPPALSVVDVRFSWTIPLFEIAFEEDVICFIEHEFELRLDGTAGEKTSDVFTMDHLPWPDHDKWLGGQAPVEVSAYGRIGGIELQPSRNLKVTVTQSALSLTALRTVYIISPVLHHFSTFFDKDCAVIGFAVCA